MEPTCHVDGFGPVPTVRPATVAELCDTVRHAGTAGEALYPLGGRTMLDLGLPPTKAGKGVDLTALDAIIDYPARDMTLTVHAGITVGKIAEILGAERQWLPIDVPNPDRATIGGAVATNASGSRRFGLGTLRDYVIGITVVNDRGEETKAGGRVVKNVAGYDLCKLYTGSLGTLGIVSQVTLKVKPIPEESVLVALPTTGGELAAKLEALDRSKTRPVVIDVLSDRAVPGLPTGEWVLVVGFADNAIAVRWQLEQLAKEVPGFEQVPPEVWARLRDFAVKADAKFAFKANLVPSGVAELLTFARKSELKPSFQAHAGNGIVKGVVTGDFTQSQAAELLVALQSVAGRYHGNVVVTRCPSDWKAGLPVWGRSTPDRVMMRAVKDKLDPGRVFNPGRFVDGI